MPVLISGSVAPYSFRQLARCFLSRFHVAQARRCHDFAVASPVQETSLKGDAQEDEPRIRERKHGFRALPVSPLMIGDGKRRQRRPIIQQDDALKEFQKEVALNPYAQALATPIRFCSLTLTRLPSHFLIPFTTTIERLPATTANQSPKLKARTKPGFSTDYDEETLAQTSYVLNRQDIVHQLARKKNWTALVTERQKAKLATIARKSASSQKLVQDNWVWENQVDAMAKMLEGKAVEAVRRLMRLRGGESRSASSSTPDHAFSLIFDREKAGATESGQPVEGSDHVFDLTTLLSPATFSALKSELAQETTGTVHISKSSRACQAQLALERVKTYKDSNEIVKDLPQKQNPPGSREARLQRMERYFEFGELSAEKEEDMR